MGTVSIYYTLIHKKINTKIPTEENLVGVSNVMPMVLRQIYFFETQGYNVFGSDILKENQSKILLDKNRRTSISKRTRHINKSILGRTSEGWRSKYQTIPNRLHGG